MTMQDQAKSAEVIKQVDIERLFDETHLSLVRMLCISHERLRAEIDNLKEILGKFVVLVEEDRAPSPEFIEEARKCL